MLDRFPIIVKELGEYVAEQIKALEKRLRAIPEMTDERVAHSLKAAENLIHLDFNKRVAAGAILTIINTQDGYQAAFVPADGSFPDGTAPGPFDHGNLLGLADDDHLQYLLLAGRGSGQIAHGGTTAGGDLELHSTAHATKGNIHIGDESTYDEVNERLGVNELSPDARLHVTGDPVTTARTVPDSTPGGAGWAVSGAATAHLCVDEQPTDDGDTTFIFQTVPAANATVLLKFATFSPVGTDGFILHVICRMTVAGPRSIPYTLLDNGVSTVKTGTISLTGSYVDAAIALSSAEAALITVGNNCQLQLGNTAGWNGANAQDDIRVTQVFLTYPTGLGAESVTAIFQAAAGQAENLFEAQDSADTAMVSITPGGRLTIEATGSVRHVPGAGANKMLESDADGDLSLVAISGDVTQAAGVVTIANDAVTYAKMQNVSAASRVLGRGSAGGAGDVEEITLGGNLTMTGTVLDAVAAAASGWTDDGTVVRLTTSTDQVGIGTASPGAQLAVVNTNAASTIVAKLIGAASQSGAMISVLNNSLRNLMSLTAATINLGNSTDSSVPAVITFGQDNPAFGGPTHTKLNFGQNNNNLSDPLPTADQVGVAGARLYVYKDSGGLFDSAYGQSFTEAWVLVGPESIPYVFYTGKTAPPAVYKRWEVAGNGDQINYGRIAIRKNSGAVFPSTPELRLEETGSGTNYTAIRAAAAITSDHTYVLPAAIANGIFNNAVSGATGTLSMLTAARGDLIYGNSSPAWAKLAIGAAGTVLSSDGTDVSWAAAPASTATRRAWFGVQDFVQSNGTTMTLGMSGTYPNQYRSWSFVDAPAAGPQALYTTWRVPKEYISGGLVKVFYTAEGASDGTYHPRLHYLTVTEVASNAISGQESLRATYTTIEGTTGDLLLASTGGVVQQIYYQATFDIGTLTGLAVNDMVEFQLDRDTTQDTYPDAIRFVGMAVDFTAST